MMWLHENYVLKNRMKRQRDPLLRLMKSHLKRAFQGMDVEDDLAALGVFRPDPMFGVDHRVSFERHPPREHHIDPELL